MTSVNDLLMALSGHLQQRPQQEKMNTYKAPPTDRPEMYPDRMSDTDYYTYVDRLARYGIPGPNFGTPVYQGNQTDQMQEFDPRKHRNPLPYMSNEFWREGT